MINRGTKSIYAALDIGSSKITCAVGRINNDQMEILGCYSQQTKSVKKGVIIDSKNIQNEIINIISNVAKKTNTEISNIIINSNVIDSQSRFLKGKVNIDGEKVDDLHIKSAINNSELYLLNEDYKSIHEIIIHFDTDNEKKYQIH